VDAQPQQQFILDPQAWLEHLITNGHDTILAIDANTMVCERIDFMCIIPGLKSAAISSGCTPYNSLFNRDHIPYLLDFNSNLLVSGPAYETAPHHYHCL